MVRPWTLKGISGGRVPVRVFLYVSLKFILSGMGIVGLGRVDIFN